MNTTKNDVFFVSTLIEKIARLTKNTRRKIAEVLGVQGIEEQLRLADVNHCLPMIQAANEVIEQYRIPQGNTDTVGKCKYKVPTANSIGKVYMRLVIKSTHDPNDYARQIYKVFVSPISDDISNFNSATYYTSSDQLLCEYEEMQKEIEKQAQ